MYTGYIYRHWIINDKNIEKSYIGQVSSKKKDKNKKPADRWGNNGEGYKPRKGKQPTLFWKAIQKYGWNSFKHDILLKIECQTVKELKFWLDEWERYYIWYYNSYYKNGNGYNMTLGGESTLGLEHNKQTREKISKAMKGKLCGKENPMYGKPSTKGMLGKKHNEEAKQKMKDAKKNYVITDEAKKNMSISQKERFKNKEKHPMYGKKHSDESKRKMREKHKKLEGSLNPSSRKVVCVETGQAFETIKDADVWCNGHVGHNLAGRSKSAGKHPITGEKLHWMYYEDWILIYNKQ